MATLIAEKSFLDDLFIDEDRDNDHRDLSYFLKYDFFGYKLICEFTDHAAYERAAKDNPFWEIILDRFASIEYVPNIREEILTNAFHARVDEQSIFLSCLSPAHCQKLSQETGYIFLTKLNLADWEKFRMCRQPLILKVTRNASIPSDSRFDKWSKLIAFSRPLNSVIIFDRYILGDRTNQKLTDNLFKVLEIFCQVPMPLKGIMITVISEFENNATVKKSHQTVLDFLKKKGFKNVKLNIIKHSKAYYPKNFEGLHYRVILTNYFHFKCDDSFNFFKTNGGVNNDADLRISFCLASKNHPFFKKELTDLKAYINKLPKADQSGNENFYPDKENRLLV